MVKIIRVIVLTVLLGPPMAWADDDPSTIVSELTVTAKPKATALSGVDVSPPKKCLQPRSPPDKSAPPPKLVNTYPAKGEKVRPGLLVVRLTFDAPMACRGALWAGEPDVCGGDGSQVWVLSYDRLNLRVLCRVEPYKHYFFYLNRLSPQDFQGLSGLKPAPNALSFGTTGQTPIETVQEAVAQDPVLGPALAARNPRTRASGEPVVAQVDKAEVPAAPASKAAPASADTDRPTQLSGVIVQVPAKPTALSGITVEARRATPLSGLVVTAPCAMPADNVWPEAYFAPAPLTAYTRTEPSPGLQAALEEDIAEIRNGTRDCSHMTVAMCETAMTALPEARARLKCLGPLKAVKFRYVSELNFDDYEFIYENGAMEWADAPLINGQRTQSVIREYRPQPAANELGNFVRSIQRGKLDYGGLTPEVASSAEAQQGALETQFKTWGRLKTTYFVRETQDHAYLFELVFDHSLSAWEVTTSPTTGKLASIGYQVLKGVGAD